MDRRQFIQLAGKAGVILLLLRPPETLFALPPDNTTYQKQLELIQQIREMANALGMKIGSDFYTKWSKEESSFSYYTYVSLPDEINPMIYDRNGELITEEYHTLLYKTAGTSIARLTTILLNYPLETISFIAFHEATHRHIRSQSTYMPYIFEEACADVVGTHATIEFAKQYPQYFSLQKAKNQLHCMEQIDKCIISATEKYEKRDYTSQEELYKNCHDEIVKLFPKGNQFFIDRYDYPVNNAYFVRYKNYTEYYFLLNRALHKMGLNEFIPFINLLPKNEQDTKKLLEIVSRG